MSAVIDPLAAFSARDRKVGIGVAIACIALVGVGLSLSIPLLAFAMESRGASGALIGFNTAMGGIATVVTAPFIPRVASRFGVRATLFAALALGALSILGFAFVAPLWAWFPLRFAFGVALAILFVLSEFWINALAPPASRGLVMGVYATALSIGLGSGPLILAGVGMDSLAPYFACAALFLVAGAPLLFAGVAAPPIERAAPGRGILFFLAVAPVATLSGFTFGAVETGAFAFLPLYGVDVGLAPLSAALLVTAMEVGNVALQIPLGLVSDRMDRRLLLLIIGVVGLLGAIALPFAGSGWGLYVTVAAWGGVVCGLYTVALAHLGARFSGVDLATANAAFVVMYSLGLIAGPPTLGVGFDLWPPYGVPVAIAVLMALFVAVAAARLRSA
ncbi:MFS transporter [Methylopila henanensis]|uniref:MFS transporter n=1 Tax=Methylopila henanensis TaxID=873516 RepID=A0ABW4K277_9HYPH